MRITWKRDCGWLCFTQLYSRIVFLRQHVLIPDVTSSCKLQPCHIARVCLERCGVVVSCAWQSTEGMHASISCWLWGQAPSRNLIEHDQQCKACRTAVKQEVICNRTGPIDNIHSAGLLSFRTRLSYRLSFSSHSSLSPEIWNSSVNYRLVYLGALVM